MQDWKYVLIDLDGTLTDSSLGITACIKYALSAANRPIPEEKVLLKFIGPPLINGFQENVSATEEEAVWLTAKYRERYNVSGLFEASLYPGVDEVLALLCERGIKVSLATSKPEKIAIRIIEYFGLRSYFNKLVGADPEASRYSKQDVIVEALRRLEIEEEEKKHVLMIGDRKYDIEAAKACGISSLGVYYGFAEAGELEAAGADFIVPDTCALKQFFNKREVENE